ncbi:MAG TPA: efflux RND transporter periplasmic adaptor subunit [Hyphomicrobium sp.]|nr:efflux RND transporter periplasmic adaptor subunit [Hyphomicrobium sp.]
MGKPLKYLFTLGIPLALAGLGFIYMLAPRGKFEEAILYETVPVERGTIRKIVATSGPVRALVTVSVGSQLSGQIDKLYVDFNSEVKEGDLMATLDSRTYDAKVAQARADLLAARAGLLNQQATMQRNQAILAQAKRSIDRQSALEKKGFAATATLENAQRDYDIALADIEVTKAQIETAKAVIAQREAALKQAEVDLERTRIVAPVNGTVISRTIDVGQTVAASLQAPELFKLAQDLRRISIEAQVNEADVGAVAEGNPVTFTVDAYPERIFEGTVTQVRLAATELQNVVTYTVIIEASNDDRRLFPGMTANVQIEAAKKDDALRVPNEALRFRPRSSDKPSGGTGEPKEDRSDRIVARLKSDLQLTPAQEEAVREALKKLHSASAASGTSAIDRSLWHQMTQSTLEQTLRPLMSETQMPLYEKWKSGRAEIRSGNVYVLDITGAPERRYVRLGISDDQYSEITGGNLKEGERVVVRAREARK